MGEGVEVDVARGEAELGGLEVPLGREGDGAGASVEFVGDAGSVLSGLVGFADAETG